MRFKVEGARRDSGAITTMVVQASSESDAEAIGRTPGVYVSDVVCLEEPPAVTVATAEKETLDVKRDARKRQRERDAAGAFIAVVIVLIFGFVVLRGIYSSLFPQSNQNTETLTYEQRKVLADEQAYQRQLRSVSDRSGYTMTDLDAVAKQFRANGVGESDEERVRLAEKAIRLDETIRNRK